MENLQLNMAHYQVKTHKETAIKNNPDDWRKRVGSKR